MLATSWTVAADGRTVIVTVKEVSPDRTRVTVEVGRERSDQNKETAKKQYTLISMELKQQPDDQEP